MAEIDVSGLAPGPGDLSGFYDAIKLAQPGPGGSPPAVTWLIDGGEPVAAIVPVEAARYARKMAEPPGRLG